MRKAIPPLLLTRLYGVML